MSDEIVFRRGVKLQKLNRVAIPAELLENLGIEEGDELVISYNAKDKSVVVRKEGKNGK